MRLLEAVNTVLPYLGEHTITHIEGNKHPSVDLILAAMERHKTTLLSNGWWFNEGTMTIPVNTDGMIDVPVNTLQVEGIDCYICLDGERFFNLENNSRYFDKPITIKMFRDLPFERLPEVAALVIIYRAAIEVYSGDFGADNVLQTLQMFAETNRQQLMQENLRNRKYNSHDRVRRSFTRFNHVLNRR